MIEQVKQAHDFVLIAMRDLYEVQGSISLMEIADELHRVQRKLRDWIDMREVAQKTREKEEGQ